MRGIKYCDEDDSATDRTIEWRVKTKQQKRLVADKCREKNGILELGQNKKYGSVEK